MEQEIKYIKFKKIGDNSTHITEIMVNKDFIVSVRTGLYDNTSIVQPISMLETSLYRNLNRALLNQLKKANKYLRLLKKQNFEIIDTNIKRKTSKSNKVLSKSKKLEFLSF